MEYNKNIIDKLKSQIKNQINEFEYSQEIIDKMYREYKKNNRLKEAGTIIEIKDNKIIIELMCTKEVNRTNAIISLISKSIEYIKKKKMNYPNTKLFLFVSDVYTYWDQSLPLFVIAKPKNKKGILIPDNTFKSHSNVNKISENWETTKEKCIKKIISFDKKKDVLFFIGGNTDTGRQNIRENLFKLSNGETILGNNINKSNLSLQIEFAHNRDVSEFTEFKYLLNLPGNQPWSYRFKYLFLAKSLVINIDVRQKFGDVDYFNSTWINFFDIIFEPNIDYVNLEYYWIESNQTYNDYQFVKLIKDLELVYSYYKLNPEEAYKVSNSGFDKVLNITEDLISESIFLLTHYYAKKINQFL
jgi:hypothetical protein